MTQPESTPATPAYSPRYLAAVGKLLSIEGGFVDDPADHGGATNLGISLRFLLAQSAFPDHAGCAQFDLDMDGDVDVNDIRLLRRPDATLIYYRCFWVPLGCNQLVQPVGEMMFNQAVNGGMVAARKLLQRAINTGLMLIPVGQAKVPMLTVDGAIGPATLKALQEVITAPAVGLNGLCTAYRDAAAERYRDIVRHNPDQKKFLAGWLARAAGLGK